MKQVLKRNGIFTLLQVLVTGGVYFFLYKYLLDSIGVDLLGVWSLVLVSVASARLSELGFASSVVKFVAKYRAKGNENKASEITETALVTVFSIILIVSILSYYPLQVVLGFLIPQEKVSYALILLPFALITLCINTVSGVMMAGLDGCQRMDIRNVLMMSGILINLGLVIILLPDFGFIALAYSQLFQSLFILLTAWVFLRKELPSFHLMAKWRKNVFLEIWRYSITFQFTSVISMTYEPVTKGLLSYFGGLPMVGYYEMANRMVMQIRSLIVSVNRIFVPAVAEIVEIDVNRVKLLYLKTYDMFFSINLLLFGFLIVAVPAISDIWMGDSNQVFIVFSWLLVVGWMINTFAGSAFFFNQGAGSLRPNLIAHSLICVLNVTLGLFLGFVFGGFGVVIGWSLSLVVGSILLLIQYHLFNEIPMAQLIPESGWNTLLLVTFASSVVFGAIYLFDLHGANALLVCSVVYAVIVMLGLFMTLIGKRILALLS
ncbi:polysaccharide biosynthesis protein [Mariprofundus micogutta]|uniref:Polysaccharide biosynthesis protein n=1 Tax=Mariprofundus micogutta TaxID=1921010 RepID=A0A1L8CLU9_9PROT|nr:oligosaccharide flippase family protein [Mariprofundus micogutta]GAV19884.1 polysaccharide biosynthesis protein [Mariprofundus micogutta]